MGGFQKGEKSLTESDALIIGHQEDYLQFIDDTRGENILQIVLRGHLYIERELTSFLEIALEEPGELLKGRTFYGQKLNIARSIGILSKGDKKSFEKVGELRNSYAHKWGFELEESHFNKLVDSFSGKLKERYDHVKKKNSNESLATKVKIAIGTMWIYLRALSFIHKKDKERVALELEAYQLQKEIIEMIGGEEFFYDLFLKGLTEVTSLNKESEQLSTSIIEQIEELNDYFKGKKGLESPLEKELE